MCVRESERVRNRDSLMTLPKFEKWFRCDREAEIQTEVVKSNRVDSVNTLMVRV